MINLSDFMPDDVSNSDILKTGAVLAATLTLYGITLAQEKIKADYEALPKQYQKIEEYVFLS